MTTNGNTLRLAGWISVLLTFGTLIWKAAEFRTEVRTDMAWVKTSLATIVTRFNELDVMKTRLEMMDATGTSQMKDVTKRLERVERELEAHELTTTAKKP